MASETIEREALRILAGSPCPRCFDTGLVYDKPSNGFAGAPGNFLLCNCAVGRRLPKAAADA